MIGFHGIGILFHGICISFRCISLHFMNFITFRFMSSKRDFATDGAPYFFCYVLANFIKNRVLWVKWGRYFSLFLLRRFHAESNQGVNYSAIHDGFLNSFFIFRLFITKTTHQIKWHWHNISKLNFQPLITSSCNYIKSIAIKGVNFNISLFTFQTSITSSFDCINQ